jgi:hypothetical protein
MGRISKKKGRVMSVRRVDSVRFRGRKLILVVDKRKYSFDLSAISPKLVKAGKKERESFEVSPSGYGIYWPLLDEDLSIEALLKTSAGDGASVGRH